MLARGLSGLGLQRKEECGVQGPWASGTERGGQGEKEADQVTEYFKADEQMTSL